MAMSIDKQNQRNWMGESNPNTQQAKDAARWRKFKGNHELLWTGADNDGNVKWVRYIKMPEPDISVTTDTSVMDQLEAVLDAMKDEGK